MRTTDTHIFFWGEYFSNWYPCNFKYEDMDFSNSEQAFMWEKARYFKDIDTANQIMRTDSPREAKRLGRLVKGFDVDKWAIISYIYMVGACYAKFKQNEDLKKILLATGDKTLVEANPYDKIWGIGLSEDNDDVLDETKWQGENYLGKALMVVRRTIKEEE